MEGRSPTGSRAQRVAKQRDVLLLVRATHRGEPPNLAPQIAFPQGLLVERRLEVLEQEREIQNLHIAVARGRLRMRRPRSDEGEAGYAATDGENPADERGTR